MLLRGGFVWIRSKGSHRIYQAGAEEGSRAVSRWCHAESKDCQRSDRRNHRIFD